jgi:hypothetical protein
MSDIHSSAADYHVPAFPSEFAHEYNVWQLDNAFMFQIDTDVPADRASELIVICVTHLAHLSGALGKMQGHHTIYFDAPELASLLCLTAQHQCFPYRLTSAPRKICAGYQLSIK